MCKPRRQLFIIGRLDTIISTATDFMTSQHTITTDLAQDADAQAILQLTQNEWPDDFLTTLEGFMWWRNQNPAGRAIIPVIRNHQNNIVGSIWVLPINSQMNGQKHLIANGANLIIHPDYRDSLGYVKLMRRFKRVFKDEHIPLHFSFIQEKKFQKQKIQKPGTTWQVPLLVKPLDFRALAQTSFSPKWARFFVNPVTIAAPKLYHNLHRKYNNPDIQVQYATAFDSTINKFWLKVQNKYPIMTIRNQDFLEWRFAKIIGRDYHVSIAKVNDEIVGYVVLRFLSIQGVKTGLIMDLLVTPNSLGTTIGAYLMAKAEAYFRQKQASIIVGLMNAFTTEYHILRQAGYIKLPSFLSPHNFYFAYVTHGTNDLSLLSEKHWFITLADYDGY